MTKRKQRFLTRFEGWESYTNECGNPVTRDIPEIELLDQINAWAVKNHVLIVNYERIINSGYLVYIIFYEECD